MNSKKYAVIIIVIAIIVGAGAFYGGTFYEKNSLSKQGLLRDSAQNGNGQRRGPGQGQGGGFSRGGGPNGDVGSFVAGDVMSKDDPAAEQAQNGAGKSITVKTRDGGSKIIFFSDSTIIAKSVQGSSSDLSVGQQVMASGKTNSDGTLTADNIQIRPAQ